MVDLNVSKSFFSFFFHKNFLFGLLFFILSKFFGKTAGENFWFNFANFHVVEHKDFKAAAHITSYQFFVLFVHCVWTSLANNFSFL